jgi:hypothetical protein
MDNDQLDKLEALACEAMPGPWEVQIDERPHHRGGVHHERRIATSWEHGQLKAKYPVVTTSIGIGKEKDGPPHYMVGMREEDANFIAAANPEIVLALIALARRSPAPVCAEPEDAYGLADSLYDAGYSDRKNERDYDPRATFEWQAVVDAVLAHQAAPAQPEKI